MDIHKPKPWRGWREFLKEYLTIVVGVLTALGAEQAVELAHNAMLAREAQASIDKEIRLDLGRVAYRLQQEPCVERRLDELTALVGRWRDDDNAIAPGIVLGDPGGIALVQESWQANLNDGRYSHEPEAAQVGQAFFYTAFRVLDDSTREEYHVWARLRTLQLGSAYLTRASRPQIIQDLQTARSEARILNNVGLEVLNAAAKHRIAPGKAHAPAIAGSTCQPLSPAA
jgi:hypothetical protein